MEEDIKILNNFIKMDFKNPMGWTGYYDTELEELRQALANLLASYKQLEEENSKKSIQIRQLKSDIQDLENECIALHNLIDEEM